LAASQTITLGQSVNLITIVGGTGPWDVVYNDGTNDVTLLAITSPYVFTPANVRTYEFTLVSVREVGGCLNTITDGVTTTITVNADLNNDATLIDLSVSEGVLDPVFDADVLFYTVDVAYQIENITISAQVSDPNATLTDTGTFGLSIGFNTFHVVVTAEDGITIRDYTVIVFRHDYVGIEQPEEVSRSINVYPNPTQDILNVVSDLPIKQIDIYDINGKMVKQIINPEQSISLIELTKGIYMLQIQTDKGIAIKKVTKK
jgi:hypothetical protein